MFGGPPRPETGLFAIVTLPNGEQVMHPVPQGASDGDIRGLFAAEMAQRGINSQDQAVQRPGMFAGQSNEQYWLDALKGQGALQAPEPTLTGKMHDMIAALGGNTRYSNHFAGKATSFLNDLTPVGDAVSADNARQAWGRGDYLSAAGNAGLAALGSAPGVGDALAGTAKAIIAPLFHGSPHKFDKFSLDKVGTGEGSQSFGHGVYLSSDRDAANFYRPAPVWNRERDDWDRRGSLYEVSVDVMPEDLLDWNAPLDQQPQHIRDAIQKIAHPDTLETRGRQIADGSLTGPGVYHAPLQLGARSSVPASDAWLRAGVPGLKYRDAGGTGSRFDNTENYLIFDPELIDILKRY